MISPLPSGRPDFLCHCRLRFSAKAALSSSTDSGCGGAAERIRRAPICRGARAVVGLRYQGGAGLGCLLGPASVFQPTSSTIAPKSELETVHGDIKGQFHVGNPRTGYAPSSLAPRAKSASDSAICAFVSSRCPPAILDQGTGLMSRRSPSPRHLSMLLYIGMVDRLGSRSGRCPGSGSHRPHSESFGGQRRAPTS